jgi:imidazole glycerol-phosphate synthase subunit HisF
MKKKRLIPVLLLRNGWLVQSKEFKRYQNVGNPVSSVKRFSEWASDELIYLDISRGDHYDMRRDDLGHPNRQSILEIIDDVSRVTFMPITVGGRIRTIEDIEARLSRGADKISINTAALENPRFVERSAREFGSQCIVVSIDAKRIDGQFMVMAHGGRQPTSWTAGKWAREVQDRGAGEILINSVDRDGTKSGYDLELLNDVSHSVKIPVIGLGGVGEWSHFADALVQTAVDAVAAANIFQYNDQSVYLAKSYLYERGLNVRSPALLGVKAH